MCAVKNGAHEVELTFENLEKFSDVHTTIRVVLLAKIFAETDTKSSLRFSEIHRKGHLRERRRRRPDDEAVKARFIRKVTNRSRIEGVSAPLQLVPSRKGCPSSRYWLAHDFPKLKTCDTF